MSEINSLTAGKFFRLKNNNGKLSSVWVDNLKTKVYQSDADTNATETIEEFTL